MPRCLTCVGAGQYNKGRNERGTLMDKNRFAPLPPMGWNSYDYYDTTVCEADVMRNADYMAEHLKPYGWEYVVVDIQWYAPHPGTRRQEFQYIPFSELYMDDHARLLPDPERFPHGFAFLAAYVHGHGLKFGIHIMRGVPRLAAHRHVPILGVDATAADIADPSSICGWNPDMYGVRDTEAGQAYYNSLLTLYAEWGVDFIKCDDICNTNLYPHRPYSGKHEIEMLHRAIMGCGREIVLSLSPGPALIEQAAHYRINANMWRITDDFWDEWRLLKDMFRRCELWQDQVSTGCYPDCDMLPLGRIGKGFGDERTTRFTPDEQKTMLTLWCLFGSPLMLGAELPLLDRETFDLITNREVLAMRDPALLPKQVLRTEDEAVWTASDGTRRYLALFNLSDAARTFTVQGQGTELWTGESGAIRKQLAPHGCAVYRMEES